MNQKKAPSIQSKKEKKYRFRFPFEGSGQSIQTTITLSFSILTILGMLFLTVILYNLFNNRMEEKETQNAEQILDQTSMNLENYLKNMRLISDTMYYSVIKESDFGRESIDNEMNLLYDANKDNLVNIACFYNNGDLITSVPIATEKNNAKVKEQPWFTNALVEMENFHFSTPHVQNIFDNTTYRYYWVISLSRAVELTRNGKSTLGVLLIDMNYSSIEQMFDSVNEERQEGYIYLMDNNGEIIYHPKQNLIYSQLFEENNLYHVKQKDGSFEEVFQEENRIVSVKTVSYTGWKIICITPKTSSAVGVYNTRYFLVTLIAVIMLTMLLLNQLISIRITGPLKKLTDSIQITDNGTIDQDIYIGGGSEVEYLGNTLKETAHKLRELNDSFLQEQEEKRKSELDALQSQINPHFLYNALDSIVWMIEGEQYKDAVFMITQLASLFRISLSKGKSVISIEDELKHAKNYMNIQKVRYKDKFEVFFHIDPEILSGSIVKLVIQPILENAIYYAAETMDGDGEIHITGRKEQDDVFIEIKDNGLGMPEETVKVLLTENNRVHKKGSGVGLINVHKRIQLRFGEAYGLIIDSIPDEGTSVEIHLPYVPYQEKNSEKEVRL